MIESRFFKKVLTPAEVGNAGTHEKYIRLKNDFDYESFFQEKGFMNGTVRQIDFLAKDLTPGYESADLIPFKFVYYENSNGEKRLPSLGAFFESHDIQVEDIVILESRSENGETTIYFTHYKKGEIVLNPNTIYYTDLSAEKKSHSKTPLSSNEPLQQIYFGAPGTGKSYEINRLTKGRAVVRTTFHPDSDYSTFVGAYKPIMEEVETRVVPVVINGGITMDQNNGTYKEKRITYKFVKQAFLKAYLGAWRKYGESRTALMPTAADPQFLVIEEINRGNCAQIFGDIFQLLDREDNGFSSYPIEADADLQQAIAEAFDSEEDYMLPANLNIDNAIEDYTSNYDATLTDDIINGRVLLLPPNMYIWATMNTSDQSLFPIDSAFKRRWEQKYVPIDTKKESWVIKTKDNKYSWSLFLDNINAQIYDATHSEDKQLGFYFCKAKDKEIMADKFVSKVLFYIYNDVFKDYGFDREMFKDDENNPITFQSYYETDGSVKDSVIETFLKKLGVEPMPETDSNADTTKQ